MTSSGRSPIGSPPPLSYKLPIVTYPLSPFVSEIFDLKVADTQTNPQNSTLTDNKGQLKLSAREPIKWWFGLLDKIVWHIHKVVRSGLILTREFIGILVLYLMKPPRPPLGKKWLVLCNSLPCYQDCQHTERSWLLMEFAIRLISAVLATVGSRAVQSCIDFNPLNGSAYDQEHVVTF